jgi:hypothetical protein
MRGARHLLCAYDGRSVQLTKGSSFALFQNQVQASIFQDNKLDYGATTCQRPRKRWIVLDVRVGCIAEVVLESASCLQLSNCIPSMVHRWLRISLVDTLNHCLYGGSSVPAVTSIGRQPWCS